MAADDQAWEWLAIDRDPASRAPGFFEQKEELQDQRAHRCREIFDEYGLLSPERVGAKTASDFWVLIQHADANVELQADVLAAIESSPAGGYNPSERAYLVDRVRVNSGRAQLYGTQMDFDTKTGRALPKLLESPADVDVRRAEAGLEPLSEYVNGMCETHFRSNRALYEGLGVTEPYVYAVEFRDW